MEPVYLLALITVATGLILLLGWTYATTGNPRANRMLVKSLWLFVIPGAFLIALPQSLFAFPLSLLALMLLEECLKAASSRTETDRLDKFWIASLFGIWEITLAKPVLLLLNQDRLQVLDRTELLVLPAAAFVAVLMHAVTAAIYAFRFAGRLWAALAVSWAIHTIYNVAVVLFAPAPIFLAVVGVTLGIFLLLLWPKSEKIPPSVRLPAG